MKKEPTIGHYIDDEERELIESIENDFESFVSVMTPETRKMHQEYAAATIEDERTKITLRISKYNLTKLKARAFREGMPYQTLINSILHKAVN
jgi:predicted DNA binding CopG/RHH family protein